MKGRLARLLGIVVTGLAVCTGAAGDVRRSVLANASDYSFMWWANGLRDPQKVFNIQTSRFALSFDYGRFDLTHLQPLGTPPSQSKALVLDNKAIFGEPNVSLECVLHAGGRRFRAVAAGGGNLTNCHLVESGRFFQRRYMPGLSWQKGVPKNRSSLELAAWPDRLLILLRIRPETAVPDGGLEMTLTFKRPGLKLLGPGVFALKGKSDGGTVIFPVDGSSTGRRAHGRVCSFRLQIGKWPAGRERQLGIVLYPAGRGFSSLLKNAVGNERSPVKVTAVQTRPVRADLTAAYDRQQGWHYVGLRNDVPDKTPAGRNNRIERVALTLANSSGHPRVVRLCFGKAHTFGITGISAIIRDAKGNPVGLPVQISKNWHTREPGRYKGPWYRGLTMLTVPASTTLKIEYVSVNAHWGGAAAASHAQLCLVGWGSNQLWDEAALGSWGESICFEPDQGQRGGAVLDTRPLMVHAMGDAPKRKWGWTHNVGGADFLVYYDPAGRKQYNSRMRTLYRRYCPVLTETVYAGRSHNRNIDLQYTTSLYRSNDITRGVYRFSYDIRRDTPFSRLVLFQCGGDDYSYTGERKFARGNADGLAAEWNTSWGRNRYKTRPAELAGRVPWISMHEAVRRKNDGGAWANRGVIIRSWDAKLGGRPARPWAAERGAKVRGRDTSLIDILPPPGVTKLLKGDYVRAVVEHVVIPQYAKDYYGPNANLRAALAKHANTWRMIHREAVGNDLDVKVTRGRLVRTRPTMIEARGNRAEFTITGGLGYVPLTISGLTDYMDPLLEIKTGDKWERIDQSVHGRDFWQCDYDAGTRTWAITYSIPLDSPGDARTVRSFRFSVGGARVEKLLSDRGFNDRQCPARPAAHVPARRYALHLAPRCPNVPGPFDMFAVVLKRTAQPGTV